MTDRDTTPAPRGNAMDPVRPLVTVAIPTRDRPESLRRTLASILRGTLLPGEIVVCDQSESQADIALGDLPGAALDVPIRHRRVRERGVNANRNHAIHASSGEFIAFCDDDATVHPEWLERMVAEWEDRWSRGAVLITGAILPGREYGIEEAVPGVRMGGERRIFSQRPKRGDTLYGGHFGAPRAVFEALLPHPFDERLGPGARYPGAGDEDFACRVLAAGIPVVYEPSITVRHHPGPRGSWSRMEYRHAIGNGGMLAKQLLAGDRGAGKRLAESMAIALGKTARALVRGNTDEAAARLMSAGGIGIGFVRWLAEALTGHLAAEVDR